VSRLDHKLKPEPEVRRVEVITGTGRRRRFSREDKARLVEETLAEGAVISEVARRHGLSPQQLFTWRRDARRASAAISEEEVAQFVPAIVDRPKAPCRRIRPPRAQGGGNDFGEIAIEIAGVTVRVGRGADVETVAAVVRALKAGA
jgi:transposase